jgi:hypothetical protein
LWTLRAVMVLGTVSLLVVGNIFEDSMFMFLGAVGFLWMGACWLMIPVVMMIRSRHQRRDATEDDMDREYRESRRRLDSEEERQRMEAGEGCGPM